jgi:predicted Zn-dependent peptidase
MLPFLLAATIASAPLPVAADAATPRIYVHGDAGAQLVGMVFVVSAGTAREVALQNGLAALSAQTLLLARVHGATLTDRVAAAGGSIGFTVDPGVVRFAIEALPSAMPAVCADLAQALASPDTSPETVVAARAALGERIDDDERNPITVGLEMLRDSYYRGTAGEPSYGTSASLANLGPADVSGFLAAHYLRGNAFAAATGGVDDTVNAAAAAVLAALPAGTEAPPVLDVQAFGDQPKHVVAQRDIGVPFVLVGFSAPAMSEHDFAGMLVLRALLDDIASRPSSATLEPFQRGIDVIYAYDVKPATFTVAINGSRLDPSAGLTVLQAVLKTTATKLNDDVIARYKETARGDWALEAMTLTDRAWEIGAAVNEGADPAQAQSVAAAIDAVTAADVQRLVKTYLQHYTVALVLPRTRS